MEIQNTDCFTYLKTITSGSIDHVVIDPPFGVLTGHKIETIIDKDALFAELYRILPAQGFCVFFGMFPTLTAWCIAAEKAEFQYDNHIVWAKRAITSPYLPIQRSHEEIMIFKRGQPQYVETSEKYEDLKIPAMWLGLYEYSTYATTISDLQRRVNDSAYNMLYFGGLKQKGYQDKVTNDAFFNKSHEPRQGLRPDVDLEKYMLENSLKGVAYSTSRKNDDIISKTFPSSQDKGFRYRSKWYCNVTNIWSFLDYETAKPYQPKVRKMRFKTNQISTVWSYLPENQTSFTSKKKQGINHKHPTVKSLKLMERIVKLISKEGETILDCFSGSGSTAVACINTNRNFVGCELDTDYYNDSILRIKQAISEKQNSKEITLQFVENETTVKQEVKTTNFQTTLF